MTPEQLNKRIQTTTDLRNIVSTMKMLSSVSVTQFAHAETELKTYTKTLQEGFNALAAHNALQAPKLKPENNQVLILLIGSDNGLVGVFNKGILSAAQKYIQQHKLDKKTTPCICLGRRLSGMARFEDFNLIQSFPIPNNIDEIANNSSTLLHLIQETILEQKIEQVVVFYNQKERETSCATTLRLLPIQLPEINPKHKKVWSGRSFPMFSVSADIFFHALIHEYIVVILMQTIISSLACEHFVRMIHMQQAEKNIDETLEEMNLLYAQERQTTVTNELIDIVSGANSVKKKKKNAFSSLTNQKKQVKKSLSEKGV